MRKFLITLSGAQPDIVRRCPTEHGKFEGIGGAVLTTGVLAIVSMTFALYSALGISIFLAVPASVLWGLAIMSLDRWLVGSIQTDGPRRWRLVIPRILMAVLLGAVISTPLVLQIFKSEIDAQIVQIRQDRANSFTREQKKGDIGQDVTALRQSVADLRKVIASQGDVPQDPAKDPKIKALTAERDAQKKQADEYYDKWQCQLYGGPTCPRKGDGVVAKASKAAYDKASSRLDTLNKQVEKRKRELTANDETTKQIRFEAAKAELPKVQEQLDAAVRRQSDLQESFDAENRSANGLLIRLRALNEVSGRDFTLNAARLLLFLLFLLIECLPVTVKMMQKPGNYEKILDLAARHEFRSVKDSFVPGAQTERAGASSAMGDIWRRDATSSPKPDTPGTVPMPPSRSDARDGSTTFETRPDALDPEDGHVSLEDEALRQMPDTWVTRTTVSGQGAERSGGFELFPDDE
ncbi:DUF4407 domain-containing protein [Streptosporangium sp. NPDC001559]|uniref:DUF4407 domain-containing protein n=1 Tax=Streptosporangium sp. NPDC001559 TaxID=3366187 RepID=UPI0036E7DC10